jgi:hypothetical protein
MKGTINEISILEMVILETITNLFKSVKGTINFNDSCRKVDIW